MKVVASRDFLNVPTLSFSGFTDASGKSLTPHKLHVPKGARFELGTADQKSTTDLSAGDKLKAVQLLPGGGAACIVFASDTLAVERIDKQVALKATQDAQVKAAAPPTIADLMNTVNGLSKTVGELLAALAAAKPLKA